jgi:hypothetical protein
MYFRKLRNNFFELKLKFYDADPGSMIRDGQNSDLGWKKIRIRDKNISCSFLRLQALSRDECRPECEDGKHLDLEGNCVNCPQGTYRRQGQELGCTNCPKGFTTSKQGEKN